nr:FkbM family methyltransferase [Neoroseomonas eburnea]
MPDWQPQCIFDVGANKGQSCTAYAGMFPAATIHAFEPVPQSFESLRIAAGQYPNIAVHQLALSSAPGIVKMTAAGASTMNRIVSGDTAESPDGIEVRAVPGHIVAAELGISRISFLKIDTEGHDLDVLLGFSPLLPQVDFVEVEAAMNPYNKTHVQFRLLEDTLRNFGFLLFRFYEQAMEFQRGGRPVLRRTNPLFINQRLVDTGGIQ